MSTTQFAASSIDPNDPQLTQVIHKDYTAIQFTDSGPEVTERYENVAMSMQRYALSLAKRERTGLGSRVLGCCRSGTKHKVCKRGKFAGAHRHHCGDPFCLWCSSGEYRFNKWVRTRDHAAFKLPHMAFEIRLDGVCGCDIPWAEKQLHTTAMLGGIAWSMLKNMGLECVTVDAYAENISRTAVRVVFPGSLTYTQLQYWAEKTARSFQPGCAHRPIVTIKRGTTQELFYWAFNGFKECASMDADKKADLRIALHDQSTVLALGELYKPLTKEQLKERAEQRKAEPCVCPVCKDHDLDIIPLGERHVQPVEDIDAEYEMVDWHSDQPSPFAIRRESLTNKPIDFYQALSAVDPSPPPI